MLDANIDPLLDVPVSNSLVNYDADGGLRHVVDYAGLAVVDFVGHPFLDGAVGFDVDDVSNSGEFLVRCWCAGSKCLIGNVLVLA